MDLSSYAAVLLDLDGTVYHEDEVLPGAAALIGRLREAGQEFACLSNSTLSPRRVRARLLQMGIELPERNIYTAAVAAADYVLKLADGRGDLGVFNLATESLQEMLEGRVRWVEHVEHEPPRNRQTDQGGAERAASDGAFGGAAERAKVFPENARRLACDVVVTGTSTNFFATEERQRTALALLRGGAALLGMCADRVYPSPRGLEFGGGALAYMLGYAANVRPVFTGKPEKVFFHELCQRLAVAPEKCLLIGDNLESDIGGAKGVGMRTILTLTGVTRREDLAHVADHLKPDEVIESLESL